jgi:hypothetical protein
MVLFMRGCLPIHLNQMGLLRKKTRTLTNLVNAMLDTASLSKAWWGEALLNVSHVLSRIPNRNKRDNPI